MLSVGLRALPNNWPKEHRHFAVDWLVPREWTECMDGMWKENKFSLYSCPKANHGG